MNIKEIIERALQEPTLLDALSFASVMDTERAIKQAIRTHNTNEVVNVDTGAKWETFSTYLFKEVAKAWDEKYNVSTSAALLAENPTTKEEFVDVVLGEFTVLPGCTYLQSRLNRGVIYAEKSMAEAVDKIKTRADTTLYGELGFPSIPHWATREEAFKRQCEVSLERVSHLIDRDSITMEKQDDCVVIKGKVRILGTPMGKIVPENVKFGMRAMTKSTPGSSDHDSINIITWDLINS